MSIAETVEEEMAWLQEAECRGLDPDMFFPTREDQGAALAKAVCKRCSVRGECLEYALSLSAHYDHGIWGGQSSRERRRTRRLRARLARHQAE